jgi:hypothetical protein
MDDQDQNPEIIDENRVDPDEDRKKSIAAI